MITNLKSLDHLGLISASDVHIDEESKPMTSKIVVWWSKNNLWQLVPKNHWTTWPHGPKGWTLAPWRSPGHATALYSPRKPKTGSHKLCPVWFIQWHRVEKADERSPARFARVQNVCLLHIWQENLQRTRSSDTRCFWIYCTAQKYDRLSFKKNTTIMEPRCKQTWKLDSPILGGSTTGVDANLSVTNNEAGSANLGKQKISEFYCWWNPFNPDLQTQKFLKVHAFKWHFCFVEK